MPSWWSWVVLVLFTAASVGLNTVISTRTAERAIESDRRAREEAVRSSLTVLCDVVIKQEAVFRDAESEVGRSAAAAWHDLGVTYRCFRE
jgi:Na+-translocating ferredoxin:NAD+ oxidoreductase RnfG subunit